MLSGIAIENQGTAFAFAPYAHGRLCSCFGVGLAGRRTWTWECRLAVLRSGYGQSPTATVARPIKQLAIENVHFNFALPVALNYFGGGLIAQTSKYLGMSLCVRKYPST